eukprot:TRINITY_DN27451_c1_g1_i1.p1 TRINITY_DN27451_c1_g1~~TRINITY_DN27451_c1_g1_i1.p1  ORF type:complete len:201 (-),score=52.41 TRINITY_DN27451_c1_g1_i1:12-614(-)
MPKTHMGWAKREIEKEKKAKEEAEQLQAARRQAQVERLAAANPCGFGGGACFPGAFGGGCGGCGGWDGGWDGCSGVPTGASFGYGQDGGLVGKGAGFGADGKGTGHLMDRRPKGPSGPNLPRTRALDSTVYGEVVEWKGKYGWIRAAEPIEHPLARKHDGRIYLSLTDIKDGSEVAVGKTCAFYVYSDASGLGAEEVLLC